MDACTYTPKSIKRPENAVLLAAVPGFRRWPQGFPSGLVAGIAAGIGEAGSDPVLHLRAGVHRPMPLQGLKQRVVLGCHKGRALSDADGNDGGRLRRAGGRVLDGGNLRGRRHGQHRRRREHPFDLLKNVGGHNRRPTILRTRQCAQTA